MQWKPIVQRRVGHFMLILTAGSGVAQERLSPVVASPPTPTFSFGMIGLGTTSTARLNVLNLVRTPPPILIAQVPCKVELDLYDSQGKPLKQKTIPNLGYGQADFLDISRSEVATAGTHVEITAVVRVGSNQSFFCSVSPTFEIFDSVTGATTAVLTTSNMSPPLIWASSLNPMPGLP